MRVRQMDHLRLLEKVFIVFVLCTMTTVPSSAQTFSPLHSFDGADGANPLSGLLQGADGISTEQPYAAGPTTRVPLKMAVARSFKSPQRAS
jgi:hypothetical protein